MNHARRWMLLLLAASLALTLATGLAACGESTDDGSPPAAPVEPPAIATPISPADRDSTPTPTNTPESPAPFVESPTPAAVPEPPPPLAATPEPITAPDAAATPAPAEVDTFAPIEGDVPPPIVPATPTGPAVPVTGPLLVLSERVGVEDKSSLRETEIRRVSLYDVGAERYWTAFDYRNVRSNLGSHRVNRSAVQLAGTHLLVWSLGQVHRVDLTGHTEAGLFEHAEIRAIEVSPDGTHVAVLYGWPGTLVVLDSASGTERLRVASDDPALGPLRNGGRTARLELGDWHADGNALSITADDYGTDLTAIVKSNGSIRVLPQDWFLSPDLRYAIRFGEVIEATSRTRHAPLWDRWEVVDVETGRLLWTIADEDGIQRPYGFPSAIWLGQSQYVAFAAWSAGGGILDTATGEIGSLTPDIRRLLQGPVLSNCKIRDKYDPSRSAPCDVRYDGRVVWEGAGEWTWYLGIIQLPGRFALRGITLLDRGRDLAPGPPPPREEMVGPLLIYEVGRARVLSEDQLASRNQNEVLSGYYPFGQARRVIAHDAGTGRTWSVLAYPGASYSPSVHAAYGGLVADTGPRLVYVAPDGQAKTLSDQPVAPYEFQVSPDGRKVVVARSHPDRLVVLALPSGNPILRIDGADLIAALGLVPPKDGDLWIDLNEYGENVWTADSAAILVRVTASLEGGHTTKWLGGGMVALDGEIRLVSCVPEEPPLWCLSPDGRYTVRGGDSGSSFRSWDWSSFDIIERATGRLLRTVQVGGTIPYQPYWEWASTEQFAWSTEGSSSGIFNFTSQRPDFNVGRANVSVLDIASGTIEVMDSTEYLTRFRPPPRATSDCPENPAQPCRILLDGAAVGEGRWPSIVGFVDLD